MGYVMGLGAQLLVWLLVYVPLVVLAVAGIQKLVHRFDFTELRESPQGMPRRRNAAGETGEEEFARRMSVLAERAASLVMLSRSMPPSQHNGGVGPCRV
ncbi:MAG: hypothetical protein WA962_08455 [Ornithinimicrobium sp.]